MNLSLLIFAAVYLVIALGRLPGLRLDRTGAAIIGASLMLATGVLTMRQAAAAVDFNTLALLFGMMVVVAHLRFSGFFALISGGVIRLARRSLVLLGAVVAAAGILSAFFVNDAVCVALTPLVLEITGALKRRPTPYLLALAMASNVGSLATITGNPQNMMISSFSGIAYRPFAAALAPVAAASLLLTFAWIAICHPQEFFTGERLTVQVESVRLLRGVLWKSALVATGIFAAFFLGSPAPQAALLGAAVLLVTRRLKPKRIYEEIDWALLALFAGLFVVVEGVETAPLFAKWSAFAVHVHLSHVVVLSAFAAVLSNLVSNVPAVLLFKPLIPHLAHPHRSWLVLAMASTLAGNLTVAGSVANLIVLEKARPVVKISFWEYCRVGAPLAMLTILLGVLMLG
jgi:Na+/H+ antiporter NhaD/arsenite permease-like protein